MTTVYRVVRLRGIHSDRFYVVRLDVTRDSSRARWFPGEYSRVETARAVADRLSARVAQ